MKKIITISFFLLCIALGLVYIFWGEAWIDSQKADKEEKEAIETYDEKVEREANDYGLESRLPYDKDFHVIGIGEINTSAYLGGTSLHVSSYYATYNDIEKTMYFYEDAILPTENADIIVIKEVYSLDSLLEQELLYGTDGVSVQFPAIQQDEYAEENELIHNENRLFLDARFDIHLVGEDRVEISFDEQTASLGEGETETYDREDGEIRSKIAVTYFGKWNSADMKYIVGE